MTGNRAAWGTISRDQIVAAATRIVRAGAYENMTMRSLALELGVSPMSLYRHVRDKDDILDEVVDRLLARAWRPSSNHVEWEKWITSAADKLRRFLVAEPAALHVYLRHPVVTPAAISRMNAMMDVLRGALPDDDTARRAYAAIHTYTVGFAALEFSRSRWSDSSDNADDLVVQLASYTTREQFIDGLHALIRGLQC
ncbi:MAG TPA: TetR/AcrR family transcriptional regulator [Acidimicrobiales bacterium]|jgi:AcrR family transcriptional regulator|nr:TetR/AcrR family transcriptional regulator [Acidimicrobiales bacterium]